MTSSSPVARIATRGRAPDRQPGMVHGGGEPDVAGSEALAGGQAQIAGLEVEAGRADVAALGAASLTST